MKVCLACAERFVADDWKCPRCGSSPIEGADGTLRFVDSSAGGGFKQEYFAELAELEASNFWFRSRNRLITWAWSSFFSDARTFLEVGCGNGFVLEGLHRACPELELAGAELFDEGLAVARARLPDIALYKLDARRLPFDSEFDAVGAFDVLEHIPEDDVALAQLHQAVRPGGGLLLTVPQHPLLWSAADEYASHERRYTRLELVEKVEDAGFEVLHTTSFIVLLLPMLIASRLRRRKLDPTRDPLGELRLGRFVNNSFERVVSCELALTERGVRWPVGGSILLLGRRPTMS